jgi:hypothetical protein
MDYQTYSDQKYPSMENVKQKCAESTAKKQKQTWRVQNREFAGGDKGDLGGIIPKRDFELAYLVINGVPVLVTFGIHVAALLLKKPSQEAYGLIYIAKQGGEKV